MFFVFGISNGEKELDFVQTMLCSRCGQFGRFQVYVTYMYFSLFFIPIFKWGKRYYVKSTCCHTLYELDTKMGKRIQHGEAVTLSENDLHAVNDYRQNSRDHCQHCGYPAAPEYDFCPKCGRKL